ncbi:hypothetical protein VKT23_012280 [Stygiomarasmius scandens]|uniref:Transmembrane protein n=1 Tax=Marasmiellus scandens TaxID=2682957 RepID=A0ABR1JB39_9AGAR
MSIRGTPSTPIIIVDDRDDNIVYKGHWNQDDDSSDFKILFDGTGTYGVDVGANASFTFVGSYIAVYAQVDPDELSVLDISLDNGTQKGSFNSSTFSGEVIDGYHIMLWESSRNLEDTNHTIVLTQTAVDTRPGLTFDFFVYIPTKSTKMSDDTSFLVDDRDPGVVYGENGWNEYDLATPPINHTLSYTSAPGCELNYTFQGTGISMYGMLESSVNGGTTLDLEVTIDDQEPSTFQLPLPDSVSYGSRYFIMKDLGYGNHTVKVKNTNNETVDFDYFLVTAGTPPPTSSSVTASATNTPTTAPNSGEDHSVPVGPIVGGVLGALAFLVLIAAWLFWIYRKKKRKAQRIYHSEEDLIQRADPFPYSPPPSDSLGPTTATSPTSAERKGLVVLSATHLGPTSGKSPNSTSASSLQGSSSRSTWRDTSPASAGITPNVGSGGTRSSVAPTSSSSAVPYVDSGIRFDLRPPPVYTEA